MRAKDANLLLIRAFEHTPESRAEYFKIEAEKYGYSLGTFYNIMFEAYKRFEVVVNSTDFRTYETNEPGGEKHFHKKVIALFHITGGRLSFSLNSENLTELLIPLRDFGALVLPKTITQPASEPQPEAPPAGSTADKIRGILEPLREKGAFADRTHLDKIIEGFVSFKVDRKYPTPNKAVLDIPIEEFIKPFRLIQDKDILKQWEIRDLLLYYIEKSTPNNREYSEGYILKLLGNSKPKT